MKVDGTIDKFKARLVIQGFRQKEWIDYFYTYAPIAHNTTIRLWIALAAIHNLVIHQMDVKTTFLNGDLDEEVYMNQPEGFVMPGNEHKVCKLVKSLYGLKQAPKQWHQKFDEVVLSSGFLLNQSDKCVYSKFDSSGKGVIICLYVDDMLIFSTDQNQVDKTKKFLSSKFSMKYIGEPDVILGIKIKCENKRIVITQSHYIEKILKKFNREDCSPVSTPMDPVEKLKPNTGKPLDQLEYYRAIGYLMYAMTSSRLDIAYVVEAYSDTNWINHVEDSSFTSGWVFFLGGGAISWASKKQTYITGYTMESEFVALAAAVTINPKKVKRVAVLSHSMWIRMLKELLPLNLIPATHGKGEFHQVISWIHKIFHAGGDERIVWELDNKHHRMSRSSSDAIYHAMGQLRDYRISSQNSYIGVEKEGRKVIHDKLGIWSSLIGTYMTVLKGYRVVWISYQNMLIQKVLSYDESKSRRVSERAFMTLFGQDNETFTSTMIKERQMQLRESKVVLSKALDASLVVTECSGTKSDEHTTSSSSGIYITHVVDADIIPVNEQVPSVEVHLTAQHNVLANE
uniref:Zinc finger, CCHC-type n=1 Tax=Tanacetum cinerariifolium TaxID=118510 RepID=A0A6L2MYC4_TANCI|nr:zinc finger, CCHC-type [Tanacetum cinerariifolium]